MNNACAFNPHVLSYTPWVLLTVSSLFGAMGLATNNTPGVIASMILSPLGIPIVRASHALATLDKTRFVNNVSIELVYVAVAILIGMAVGYLRFHDERYTRFTEEMLERITWRYTPMGYVSNISIAAGAGVLLAFGSQSKRASTMIGLGIGAALLPPVLNTGLIFGASLTEEVETKKMQYQVLAQDSFLLWILNFVVMLSSSYITFKAFGKC